MNLKTTDLLLHDLAPSQIPEWYAYQLDPESAVYNISFNHFFLNGVDHDAFLRAWQHLLDRHDVFRIRMGYAEGKPKQFLGERILLQPKTLFIDCSDLAAADVLAAQERQARLYALKPFDFNGEVLFRLHLIAYPEGEYQLIFTVHHIIWDETSTINLIGEFTTLYAALCEGRAAALPELPAGFLDYADRVNQALNLGKLARHRDYWLQQFSEPPGPLALPTDRPRPPLQTYHGNTAKTWMPRSLVREINPFCQAHRCTLFMLLLGVLNLYFYRITGQRDFVLGCPIAGRESADKPLLGCFAVPLPIRCRIEPNMRFTDLLKHVSATVLAAFEHYRYPCVSMIEQLSHQKDLSRPKLFSVMAGVQNNKSEFISISLGRGQMYAKEIYAAENHGARFDLAIGLDPVGGDIKFFCTYNTDLYAHDSIERLLENLTALFAEVMANPGRGLESYPLMTAAMARRVLEDFNQTAVAREPSRTVIDFIDQQCRSRPSSLALVGEEGDVSYGELAALVDRLAQALLDAGTAERDRIGVLSTDGRATVASMLAIMRVGAVYVPLHEDWPTCRLGEVAAQVDFQAVLVTRQKASAAEPLSSCTLIVEDIQARPAVPAVPSRARPDGLAYLLFTSGTTGRPKGIPILHRSLFELIASTQERYRLTDEDRMLFWTAPSFDASLLEMVWPLTSGAQLLAWPAAKQKHPSLVLEILSAGKVTVFQTVPLMLDALSEARRKQSAGPGCLRLIICGAAALSRTVSEQAAQAFGCRLANHYGPTEATVDALWFDCAEAHDGDMVPIGRPLPNVRVFVLDLHDEPVPVGVTGQLCIASPGLSPGYWRADELTRAAFFEKRFAPDGETLRLYRTGDLGQFDRNGVLHYVGRKDKQVKVRGNRVELGDIESALLQHPAVAKAAVLWGEAGGEGKMRAFIELHDNAFNSFFSRGRHYRQYTLAQRPGLRRQMNLIHQDTWPPFFQGSPVLAQYWECLYAQFPEYQFCLLDAEDEVACIANGIPLYWDGRQETVPSGWDAGVEMAFRQHAQSVTPNTILGLAGIVAGHYQGGGLANKIVEGFRALAKMHGIEHFLGPVRPVGMPVEQRMDIHRWAEARDEQGEPIDFWLRVHLRLGAKVLGVAKNSQLVEGTLAQWEAWTGVALQTSGTRWLPDMLQPLEVDLEQGRARYYDPSIWVGHYGLREVAFGIASHYGIEDLRAYLAERLPAYMLPDELHIVGQIPLTENGKIDVQRLLAEEIPAPAAMNLPANPVQQRLADIWHETLQQAQAVIDVDHDFFLLGGQSLKVIEMLAKVEQVFGRKLRLQDFYRQPTIRRLESLLAG